MAQNLKEKFEETISSYCGKIAIEHKKDGRWSGLSYGDLKNRVGALSAFLLKKNVKKDDKIALLLENRPEWPLVFFSTVFLGAVSVPLNPESTPEEIENILRDSECRFVFVSGHTLDLMEEVRRKCPSIEEVFSVDSDEFKDVIKKPPEQTQKTETSGSALACILYTSGTTAEPKGVMLTHANLLANCDSLYRMGLVTPEDSIISVLPLHHAYPLTVTMLFPLLYGGRVVYPGSMRAEDVLKAMREKRPTVFVAVPQIFYTFHQKITDALKRIPFPFNLMNKAVIKALHRIRQRTGINLSRYFLYGIHRKFGKSMRLFASGGAKLDEDVQKTLFELGFTILEGYGLTETSPVLTFNPLEKPKPGSVGIAVPDVELQITDKDEKGTGEVIARGPNIMQGYYKKADMTAEVIKNGWFHTGDLGYFDEDGYLFLTGRLKEVLVLSSGKNIYPEEIEEVYSRHAPVKEMCVFEAPLKKGKETALWAIVVPDLEFFKKYGEVNLETVIKERFDNASRTLPAYKRLMGFSITLEVLPRTLLGKVKRYAVRELYASKLEEERLAEPEKLSEEDLELAEGDTGKKVIRCLKKQPGAKKAITPAGLLELDLGIDSLGRIELASDLEKAFGMKIKDEIIGGAFTVRDLIRGIEALSKEPVEALPEHEMVTASDPEYWRKLFQVLPREENLKKIALNPGFGAWLGCFLFIGVFYILFKTRYSLKVEDQDNLPKSGPYILYVNHTSYFDGLLVAASLPHFPKLDLFFVGFRPYFAVPIIRNLIKIGRIIPLDFSAHFLEALRSCYYVLKNKRNLCVFPEGLRTLDGNVGTFKKGFGILAKESKAKLVPVALKGAYESWPRTSAFPKRKRHPITVRFGKALDPEELEKYGYELGAKDGYEAVCLAAREALITLKEAK
jgi:long-chain acyl-CoA synthetase